MKKLYTTIIAFYLNISLTAAPTHTERVKSFAKQHETKLAVAAVAIASGGMGWYITHYFAKKRIATKEKYTNNIEKELRKVSDEKCVVTERFRDVIANLLKNWLRNKSAILKDNKEWKLSIAIYAEGLYVCLEGKEHAIEWGLAGYDQIIKNAPIWKYADMGKPQDFAVAAAPHDRQTLIYSFWIK